jgi:hypothetical protein
MTEVEILCLNHRLLFGIGLAKDAKGPGQFDVCMSAGHRMFHFYEGIHDPTPYAWIYPMTDFEGIENAVRSIEYGSSETKLNLDNFLEAWHEIVSMGFTPEWFLFHPEQFFGTDDLKVNIAPQKRKLIEIVDTLEREDESLPSVSEKLVEKEKNLARERKQAFFDLQKVDRKAEGDLLMYLRKWQKSKNLEQRWLSIMSMTHYLRSGLTDFEGFYDWLVKNLVDPSYLIRAESLDMLQSLVITNQAQSLNLIERLNNSKRFALQVAAFDLLRRVIAGDFYYGQRYHDQLTGLHKPIDERDYPRLEYCCEHTSKNLFGWLDRLMKMRSFKHLNDVPVKKSVLLKGEHGEYSVNGFDRSIDWMSRILASYKLSKNHFEIESKSKSSHF